ncbi:hypothetical protein GCM10025864_32250 [Luteimicrobium album]|uniref:SWIM-type domain-containing protein n=1 Tax=Luteimicrobium album TaxID=1054550 RepID=A0ABQ6I421_9MICO|nr:SWIM zinc finger family protein [Luteimicrobium album]GMA25466.1 hypothetical protein GCM10025864_32250 [Luteimicrobium album]
MFSIADVAALVGAPAMGRAEDYVERGRVVSVARNGDGSRIVGHVQGTAGTPYVAVVEMSPSGKVPREGRCSCPVGLNCKHVAATLLAYRAQQVSGPAVAAPSGAPSPGPELPEWERALAPLLGDEDDDGAPAPARGTAPVRGWDAWGRPAQPVALQADLVDGGTTGGGRVRFGAPRFGLRPVVLGARNRWVRTGVSWRELRYVREPADERHLPVLRALSGLASAARTTGFAFDDPTWIHPDELPASAFWALWADARRVGLPVVAADRAQTPVRDGRARSVLHVERVDDGLAVEARIEVEVPDDVPELREPALREALPLGSPAGGVVVAPVGSAGGAVAPLVLARLAKPSTRRVSTSWRGASRWWSRRPTSRGSSDARSRRSRPCSRTSSSATTSTCPTRPGPCSRSRSRGSPTTARGSCGSGGTSTRRPATRRWPRSRWGGPHHAGRRRRSATRRRSRRCSRGSSPGSACPCTTTSSRAGRRRPSSPTSCRGSRSWPRPTTGSSSR